MPCVNLAHVSALKTMILPVNSLFARHSDPSKSELSQPSDNTFQDEKSIKIPHSRPNFNRDRVASDSAGLFDFVAQKPSVVQQPASEKRPALADLFSSILSHQTRPTRADLINAESPLGSTLFGPVPAGHRREFFHDQRNIWIWHENWTDESSKYHELTIRYEVRTSGVYKKIAAGEYFKLEGNELENFRKATHAYLYLVKKHIYNQPSDLVRASLKPSISTP